MPPSPEKFLTSPVSQLCKLGFSLEDERLVCFVQIYITLCKFDVTVPEILAKFAQDYHENYNGLLLEYSHLIILNWGLDPKQNPDLLTAFEILVRQNRRTITVQGLLAILENMPRVSKSKVKPIGVNES